MYFIKINVLAPSSIYSFSNSQYMSSCFCVFFITAMYAYTSRVACGSEDIIHNKPSLCAADVMHE